MDNIAILPKLDREFLFTETAEKLDIPPLLVEKDFWVTWILNHLSKLDVADYLYFRGGTSLSKAYSAINRFSEDIDLGIDPSKLLPEFKAELYEAHTRAQIGKIVGKLRKSARQFVVGEFKNQLVDNITKVLGGHEWEMKSEKIDRLVHLKFYYPQSLTSTNYLSDYVLPSVKLELDARAAIQPHKIISITPFIAAYFENQFTEKSCQIETVTIERTFWEKAALLHRVFIKQANLPERFSRHCYDVFQLAQQQKIKRVLNKKELLQEVIDHNKIFYEQTDKIYRGALTGQLRLIPKVNLLKDLENDYQKTKVMIFHSEPSFSTIVNKLTNLQRLINKML